MSRQTNTSGQSYGIVDSFFNDKLPRMARKSQNITPTLNQKASNNTEKIEAVEPPPANTKAIIQRKKGPNLAQNVVEQDVKPSTISISTNPSKITQQSTPDQNDSEIDRKTIGLISYAFMGSTNKFVKGTGKSIIQTPNKNKQEPQQKYEPSILQSLLPKSVTSGSKFSRNRGKQTQINEPQNKPKVSSNYESESKPDTDRSMIQSSKKIQRRPAGNPRQLKFVEKHIEKQEIATEPVVPTIRQETKLISNIQVKPSNTIQSRLVRNKPQGKNIIESLEETAIKQKQKQQTPIQTINPRYPNRPLPQKLIQSKIQEVSIEKKGNQVFKQKEKQSQTPIQTNSRYPNRPLPQKIAQSKIQEVIIEKKQSQAPIQTVNPRYPNRPQPQKLTQSKIQEVIIQKKGNQPIESNSSSRVNEVKEDNKSRTASSRIIGRQNIQKVNTPSLQMISTQPSKQIIKQQIIQQHSQQNESKLGQSDVAQSTTSKLKKTAVIFLTIKRLFKNTTLDAFDQLKTNKNNSKLKNVNNCILLNFALNQIVKNKETNLVRFGFQIIKKKFTTNYIMALKPSTQFNLVNYKFTAVGLIERVYLSKLRQSFNRISKSSIFVGNISKNLTILLTLFKKKSNIFVRNSFNSIKQRGLHRFNVLLQLNNSLLNIDKQAYSFAFSKICSANIKPVSIPQPAKVIRPSPKVIKEQVAVVTDGNQEHLTKLSSLKNKSTEVSNDISRLQQKIRSKKQSNPEKQNLAKKIQILNNQNDQINNEILIKKQRNDEIKKQMDSIKTNHLNNQELQQELTEQRQNKLQFLTDIYIHNYKNAEDMVPAEQFVDNYSLNPKDGCIILTEWQAILANVELKRTLAAYEGANPKDNKARKNLIEEQKLITKLIRSYIKEQFYWTWIHISAQNL